MSAAYRKHAGHQQNVSYDVAGTLGSMLSSKSTNKRKRVTVGSLVKSINKIGSKSAEDAKIDKWVKSKRVIGATMTDTVRDYALKTRESVRVSVKCSVEPDSHKISLAAFEKMRKLQVANNECCPECKSDLVAELSIKCRYLDANVYTETVPYLSKQSVESSQCYYNDNSNPTVKLNAYKYGLLKL
jgi:hypothetical protein